MIMINNEEMFKQIQDEVRDSVSYHTQDILAYFPILEKGIDICPSYPDQNTEGKIVIMDPESCSELYVDSVVLKEISEYYSRMANIVEKIEKYSGYVPKYKYEPSSYNIDDNKFINMFLNAENCTASRRVGEVAYINNSII